MHKDVLDAQPEDDAAKEKLVEELRNRAKAAVADKAWPIADALYGKAIEVTPEPQASLFSNRSMARLSMGKFAEALEDAEQCVSADVAFAKGFYRKGQALSKLARHGEAAEAYDAGSALEPENKTFKSLAEKSRAAQVKADEEAAARAEEPPPLKETSKPKPAQFRQAAPKGFGIPSEKAGGGGGGGSSSNSSSSSSSSNGKSDMRGYRVREDGTKTTFFNNDLDDEAKALIGDIRPQKIDDAKAEEVAAGAAGKIAGSSSWNAAGTWESRNMTEWGRQRLTELLLEATFELPNDLGTVTVAKVKDLTGDADITMMRQKKKWLFDWAFTLEWRIEELKDAGPCKGTLKYPDVTPDCDGEYEAQYEVDRSTPPKARAVLETFVRSASQGIQPAVSAQIQKFIDEYNTK